MIFIRILLFPFSLIYGLIVAFRNMLFNLKILSVTKVNAKVISVGNLSVGGTGKTPHVEWIVDHLKEQFKTGILLRGYGRKTKGFQRVHSTSTSEEVGDEAINYKKVFKNQVEVAVCEKRVNGAQEMIRKDDELSLLVLDDAYQHRYIHRDFNILLTEYNAPFSEDEMLPSGWLREFQRGHKRADCIIVTKSPEELSKQEKLTFKFKLKVAVEMPVFFSFIEYGDLISIKEQRVVELPENILLVTGIGNPTPLIEHLEKTATVKHLKFKDHYNYSTKDIQEIHKLFDTFAVGNKCIVTTEKDVARFTQPSLKGTMENYPWYFQKIAVHIEEEEELVKKIKYNVRSN